MSRGGRAGVRARGRLAPQGPLAAWLVVAALLPAGSALAAPKADLVDIEDEVMCVVCERPLSTSGGEAAEDQRAVIQRLIDQGLTKQQIKDELVDEYGERVLVEDGSPVAGAAPVLAAVVGAGSIFLLLRRRRRPGAEAPSDGAVAGDNPSRGGGVGRSSGSSSGSSGSNGVTDSSSGPKPPRELSAADEARIDAELSER